MISEGYYSFPWEIQAYNQTNKMVLRDLDKFLK